MGRLRVLWMDLRSSLWFLPALLVTASVLLALLMIQLEFVVGPALAKWWPFLFGGGAEGSRGTLSAIATSMMTVAGVAFSITIVSLSLASSQYTSRVLRNFMADRTNQAVLGVLVGTFAYCLVVMRSIRSGDEGLFVPSLAVTLAIVLAFVGIGFLIYFIHHVATSIQASFLLSSITTETLAAIDHLFPDTIGREAETQIDPACRETGSCAWQPIPARNHGYLQRIDAQALFSLASSHQSVIRMDYGIGEFVVQETPLASINGESPDEAMIAATNAAFSISRQRSVDQDASFGIRQIVDIALKALSPGINDTTTAVSCVDYLTAILARLATRRLDSPQRSDDGVLRLIARGPDFTGLVGQSLDQIRDSSEGNPTMLRRLIDCLRTVGDFTQSTDRRQALHRHATRLLEAVERTVAAPHDRNELAEAAQALLQRLAKNPSGSASASCVK